MTHVYICFVVGLAMFVAGNLLLRFSEKPGEKRGKWKVLLSVVLIACGPLFTTEGWNTLSAGRQRRAQKKALILAVAREWKTNELLRDRKPLSSYERGDYELDGTYFVVPRYENYVFGVVRTSDLFSYFDKQDVEFILPITNYAAVIDETNQICDVLNNTRIAPNSAPETNMSLIKNFFRKDGPYASLLRSHRKVGEMLKKNYSWASDDPKNLIWREDPAKNPSGTK
jgi:hypothetical protein